MIRNKLQSFDPGYVFTYKEVTTDSAQKEAVIKALNRMVNSGVLCKLAQGKYYKPEKSVFGILEPEQAQIVKDLLEKDGKPIAYLTGLSIYNVLGLTSQVSNTIQIGKNDVRNKFKRGKYTISFIRQKNVITKQNIPLLQILDSLRYIKLIPDCTIEDACKCLLVIVKDLSENQQQLLVKLALKYPPFTRALLGALIDEFDNDGLSDALFETLNPITVYEIPGSASVFTTANKWNIK